VKLPKILRGAPAAGGADEPRPRRRRPPRPGGPRTIVPELDADATPSWLTAPAAPPSRASALAVDLDAARDRLRRAIPPVDDEL
jgi:hypothetical protein